MEVRNISNYYFKKLKRLKLDSSIYNTEGILYVIDCKDKWEKDKKILKFFYNDTGNIFSNKLFTLNELIDKKSVINIPEIIMPESLVTLNGKAIGFIMPYINNINFDLILNNFNISNSQKIEYFKQIGVILDKMKKVRENTTVNDFFLNDLHEKNFVLNLDTKCINIVDIDSCKISGNKPFASRYLTPMSNVSTMPSKVSPK